MKRKIVMEDGNIVEADEAIDEQEVRRRYKLLTPLPGGVKRSVEAISRREDYPIEDARRLGFSDEEIEKYLTDNPNQRERRAGQAQAEGMGAIERGVTGFAENLVRRPVRGVQQLMGAKSQEEIDKIEATMAPVMETDAGQIGGFAGNVLGSMGPGLAAKAGGSLFRAPGLVQAGRRMQGAPSGNRILDAVTQGVQGSFWGLAQPEVTGGPSRGEAAALGGLGGAGGSSLAGLFGRAANPNMSRLNPEEQNLQKIAEALYGMKFSAGQKTGNPRIQGMEAGLSRTPFGSGGLDAIAEQNKQITNRTLLNRVGGGSDSFTAEDLLTAESIIGEKFDRIGANPVTLGPEFQTGIKNAMGKYGKLVDQDAQTMETLGKWLDIGKLPGAKPRLKGGQVVSAVVPGDVLTSNRSALGRDAAAAYRSGNWQLGQAKEALVEQIDDAIEGALPAQQRGEWARTRREWRDYLALSKGVDPAMPGQPNLSKIASAITKGDPKQTRLMKGMAVPGSDPIVDMVAINKAFPPSARKPGVKPSGAIPAIGSLLGGGTGLALGGGLEGTMAGAALGGVAPFMASRVAISPAMGNYLSRSGFKGSTAKIAELVKALMAGGGTAAALESGK